MIIFVCLLTLGLLGLGKATGSIKRPQQNMINFKCL